MTHHLKKKAFPKGKTVVSGKKKAQKPTVPPKPLEELLCQALPWIQEESTPAILQRYFSHLEPKIRLPETLLHLIQVFSTKDVTSKRVVRVLEKNPYYQAAFYQYIRSLMKKDRDIPSLQAAVVLLGMQRSRNFISALQMYRTVFEEHLVWKEKSFGLDVTQTLKYALQTEEALSRDREGFAETAFGAGFVFDWFVQLNEVMGQEERSRIARFIEDTYKHSFQAAKFSIELGRQIPDFPMRKHVFLITMVHDVGKILMTFLEPESLSFYQMLEKEKIPRHVSVFAERQKFGMDHNFLGGLFCHSFSLFCPYWKVVLLSHEPYFFKYQHTHLQWLAALVALSSNVSRRFKQTTSPTDPMMHHWLTAEVRAFGFSPAQIIQALRRM